MRLFFHRITRRKYISAENVEKTQLARCLNTLDLTALGVGSTLGAGIYVVAGQVAKLNSGPSVFLSFLVAAVASILAGLCYAEFGARVPKTGSAYVYSYVTVGELMAFVIGWNLILEYVIGTSSVARAWSLYFDSLIDNRIQHAFRDHMPMNISGLSPYPDFFSFAITLLLTVILAVGVKESSRFNNLFTGVNLLVVTYIIVCGSFKADTKNWAIKPDQVTAANVTKGDIGKGGFLPFGFSGMLSGAATCFYAFVGFDAIATTGEEVKNPQKAIPVSIVVSLLICCLAYSGISVVITLMCPYYLLDHDAPLPAVFHRAGWDIAKYIIAVGAVCGLSTSLLGAMFPLPRVIYAIASDGLIFRVLASVSERFKTPFLATILSGIFAGLMAMMFDLTELVEMMSIGTLLAYTLVAVSVLLLRYKVNSIGGTENGDKSNISDAWDDEEDHVQTLDYRKITDKSGLMKNLSDNENSIKLSLLFNYRNKTPSQATERMAAYVTVIFCVVGAIFGLFLRLAEDNLAKAWAIVIAVLFFIILAGLVISLGCQPQNQAAITFKVPWVPVLPCVSIFVNTFLMIRLPTPTWYRFGVWMVLGFLLYFTYGIENSSENTFHDKVSLHTFTPLPSTDIDDCFDDSETEITLFMEEMKNNG